METFASMMISVSPTFSTSKCENKATPVDKALSIVGCITSIFVMVYPWYVCSDSTFFYVILKKFTLS